MDNNILKSKTTEELKSNLKMLKVISIALLAIVIPLLLITIYGMFSSENKTVSISLFVVAISCASMLPLQFSSLKKIKEELKSRGE